MNTWKTIMDRTNTIEIGTDVLATGQAAPLLGTECLSAKQADIYYNCLFVCECFKYIYEAINLHNWKVVNHSNISDGIPYNTLTYCTPEYYQRLLHFTIHSTSKHRELLPLQQLLLLDWSTVPGISLLCSGQITLFWGSFHILVRLHNKDYLCHIKIRCQESH